MEKKKSRKENEQCAKTKEREIKRERERAIVRKLKKTQCPPAVPRGYYSMLIMCPRACTYGHAYNNNKLVQHKTICLTPQRILYYCADTTVKSRLSH